MVIIPVTYERTGKPLDILDGEDGVLNSLLVMPTVDKLNASTNPTYPHILSHATRIPGLIFLSGQTPVDQNGNVVDGGIQEHTKQCLANLGRVLEAAESSWEKVVKVNVYLRNMDDFIAMNEIYEKYLPIPKPARTCIQAGRLPNDVDIEIEAIATT